ncbi:MAG: alpha/beta fold hydrolase [Pseudomonadales bacterium]|jgi:pimeloyl-ACP methyl ester carboxylesterase/DNA-binding CsgD family transcriptional regulator
MSEGSEASESEKRAAPSGAFFDALTAYAVDPTTWPDLLARLDDLTDDLDHWDPGALIAELSRAESLSWRIKDSVDPGRAGFVYLLMNARNRVVGGTRHLAALSEYLTVDRRGRLSFSHPESAASLQSARNTLGAQHGGHSLITLVHPSRPRQRFGFLISRAEFPPSLDRLTRDATHALFIAQDDGDQRLEKVVQASLGLTAAEVDVTMKLAQGLTLKETAEDLGISINTARNHLQSVFDKSGINRQSDLVLVVTQLSVILAGTVDDPPRPRRSPPRHFMILPDGRRLAYRTYGETTGAPAVYLHETLGCSRLPPDTDGLARDAGLYLIAPERPGFGFSDVHADFTFESVVDDTLALLDHLRVERFALLGFLAGGAYAVSLAAQVPRRVSHLMLVAGRPPRPMTGRFQHLMPLYTKMIARPWLMTSFFNILRNRVSSGTNARLIQSVYGSVPHDRALLESRPDILEHMIAYTLESVTVTAAGVAGELRCFAQAKPAPCPPLEMPVTAWHGTEDNLSSIEDLAAYLAGQTVSWRRFPDAGSLIMYEHWPTVVEILGGAEA